MTKRSKPKYRFASDIDVLKIIVSETPFEGEWVFRNDYYQFQIENKTRLSFYPTRKTMMFQGGDEASREFENVVIANARTRRTLM